MARLLWNVCTALLLAVSPAYAYVGPGVGVGTVSVVLGILASLFIALFVVLWYPFKRLIKRRMVRSDRGAAGETRVDAVGRQADDG